MPPKRFFALLSNLDSAKTDEIWHQKFTRPVVTPKKLFSILDISLCVTKERPSLFNTGSSGLSNHGGITPTIKVLNLFPTSTKSQVYTSHQRIHSSPPIKQLAPYIKFCNVNPSANGFSQMEGNGVKTKKRNWRNNPHW